MVTVVPVIMDASSLARNATSLAMSSTVASRPMGWLWFHSSRIAASLRSPSAESAAAAAQHRGVN